jgi:hypothetical protein
VERFARSLRRKHLGELSSALPLSAAALKGRFAAEARRYLNRPATRSGGEYLAGAIEFARRLEETVSPVNPPWILDLIRWERAWLEMRRPSKRFVVQLLEWRVDGLTVGACLGPDPPRVEARLMVVVWLRLSRKSRLRYFRFPPW